MRRFCRSSRSGSSTVNMNRQFAQNALDLIRMGVVVFSNVDDNVADADPVALAEIEARYEAFIAALQIEQETILRFFEMQFAERAEALQHFYDLMDSASNRGDNEQLSLAVQGIVGIIRENPLLGYTEFRQAWADTTRPLEL